MLIEFSSWLAEHLDFNETRLMLVIVTGFLSYLVYDQMLDICRIGHWSLLPRLLAMLVCIHLVTNFEVPGDLQFVTVQFFALVYGENALKLYS
ncbi:MAG: hypothetical protein U1E13_11785 [Methylophilaceae bacterium]|nr:hypothetical protein [Methylophilaceae bacterium]